MYDPQIGYYQSSKKRVGKGSENDFYTSSTIGALWGKLIIESSKSLLKGKNPHDYVFVEIGAEPEESILEGLEHPFAGNKTIRLGDLMDIPDHAIVYSNEWLMLALLRDSNILERELLVRNICLLGGLLL